MRKNIFLNGMISVAPKELGRGFRIGLLQRCRSYGACRLIVSV